MTHIINHSRFRHALTLLFALLYILPCPLLATEFKVAVRAHYGVENAYKQWQSTIDLLSENIPDHSFILLPKISLEEINTAASNNNYDFILTNPSSYVELNELYGTRIIATLNNKRANTAQNRFGSVIIVHARHEDILSLKDLKGRRLMAVSEQAFGGWRVAWLEMLKQGFDPYHDLGKLLFTRSSIQEDVVYAVLHNEVDAGVVRTDLLERLEAEGKIDMRYLRVLNNKDIRYFPFFLSTDLYPEWAFASMKHIPEKIRQRIKDVLLSIRPDNPAALAGRYIGWLEPLDYTPVVELMRKLNIEPFNQVSKSHDE